MSKKKPKIILKYECDPETDVITMKGSNYSYGDFLAIIHPVIVKESEKALSVMLQGAIEEVKKTTNTPADTPLPQDTITAHANYIRGKIYDTLNGYFTQALHEFDPTNHTRRDITEEAILTLEKELVQKEYDKLQQTKQTQQMELINEEA